MKTLYTTYNNFAKRLVMSLMVLMTVGVGTMLGAEEVYKTAKFGSNYNSEKVQNYTSSWSATNNGFTVNIVNANNNQNQWNYIKIGRDGTASTGSITTASAIDKAITKVSLTIDAITADKVTSITLKTATSSNGTYTSVGTFTESLGTQTVTLPTPTTNLFYKIEVVCASGSKNGLIQISQVDYYTETAPATHTVTIQSSNVSYGTVSTGSITNVANNATISTNGIQLTIGTTIVTATPKPQDANYNYAFTGWTGIPSGNKVTANCTITANFTRTDRELTNYRTTCSTQASVTLDPNGGTFDPEPEEWGKDGDIYTKKVDGSIELPTPTKTGYNFDGWYDGTNKVESPYSPSETMTLTAEWIAKTTYITLDANTSNNGSGANSSVTATYDQALPEFQACTPTTGYTLNGYYTATTNGTMIIDKEGKFVSDVADYTSNEGKWKNESATLTLYAQYTINSYTVTFDNQEHGIKPDNQTITHGKKVNKPTDLTESGLIFGGWYKEAECTNAWDFENYVVTSSITLYAKWTAKTATSLTWSPTSYSATIDADNTFPTLTKTPADLSPIAYSSSNTSVATIDANGNITLLKKGETTITATFEETATHIGATDSYTLTVYPSNCRWVETEIGEIDSEDEVIVTMTDGTNTWALSNHKGTASAPDAIKILVNGVEIYSPYFAPEVDMNSVELNNIIWNIERDKNDNNFIFHPVGQSTYNLYCNTAEKDNNRVRVGNVNNATINHKFVIEGNFLKNAITSHYLGIYSEKDWRGYVNSAQFSGQTLKFYKRECLDATKVWIEGNLTNVTCDQSLPIQLEKDGSITLTFTAEDGYQLPTDVTVTNATKEWNSETGKLTISDPTDDVSITVKAIKRHTVKWMVGDNTILTEDVLNNEKINATPDDPEDNDLGYCASKFMGWSETDLGSAAGQSAPDDLCYADEIKAKYTSLTADKTFYAVFATGEEGTTEVSLSFADKVQRTSYSSDKQVWEQNGITLTNDKGSSTSNVGDYAGPARFYKNSSITIEYAYPMYKIVFDCNEDESITNLKSVINDASVAGDIVTVEFDEPVESYTITLSAGQVRLDNLTIVPVTYSNYVTQCADLPTPTYAGPSIDKNELKVKCGERSSMNSAAVITFDPENNYDLSLPITLTASEGFLVSTNKTKNDAYTSAVTVNPVKSGDNKGKITQNVYVRAEASADTKADYTGTITIEGAQVETKTIDVTAIVTCEPHTMTFYSYNTKTKAKYYVGDAVEEPETPGQPCEGYVFDGWAESIVEEGATAYSKVTFPYEMPNRNTILYAVYQIQEAGSNYTKLTEDLEDYSGEYLIVYEGENVAFDGGLQTLDKEFNTISVTINSNTIESNATTDAAKFTIAKVDGGYSIKSASGYYIGAKTGNNNGLATSPTTAYPTTISIADLVQDTKYLRYNSDSNQKRFRYYKSDSYAGQKAIALYKKDISYTSYPDCTPPVEPETPQALPSAFSVSATEKVQFSAGNLQYHTRDKVWRFAPEQYDVLGEQNIELGNSKFKDWVDMFGWSTNDLGNNFGVNASNDNQYYTGTFVDWGKVFSDAEYGISADEWYTLSMNEWYYLLYTRTNASALKQVATVGDMIGVLLFPDDWVMPKGFEVNMQTDADGVEYYPYNIDQWKQLEAAGAVFLPAAGRRTGGWGNKKVSPHIEDQENPDNFDSEGYYRWQDNTNYYGYYWTSTKDDSDGRSYFLITCKIGADGETGSPSLPSLWDEEGRYGQSVRLARKLMPLQVVEWKENSVVVMYNGDPAQTASVTVNGGAVQTTELSGDGVQKDIAVYELAVNGLASSPNQPLEIAIGNAKALMTIPYIATATTTNVPNNSDLVVLKDITFTATNEQLLRNVTVYGGGMLVVDEGATLSTNSLTLRAGGVTADGNYDYVYPQFVLNGTWSNTSGKINLDYLTTKEQYYTFVAPFAVQTKDIHYPVDIYGNNVAATNTGSFEFQYYDGEARATGNTGWMVVNEDPNGDGEYEGATLTAGQGYTFLGMPKKINGTRQKYGIHRIPMSVSAADATDHEKTDQRISVAPHPSAKNNNSGWNLIGNPYMSTIGGLTNENIQVGKLVHTTDANGNWTGGWHWDEETVQSGQRFLVIPSNDGQSYEAVQASNATLPAFKNFFVQIGKENANALSIPRTKPSAQLLAPARRTEEVVKDVEVAIVLEQDEAHTDQMDFLINNIYTEDFERDADFTKMMNTTNLNLYGVHPYDNLSFVAIDNNTARGSVAIGYQVPQAGEYILRMSDKPYVMFDKIEALYVTDHEMSPEVTTDIMSEPYRFTVANAETNHTRFTVSVILKVEEDDGGGDVGTGVDNTTNNNTPCKFIYQDKMYILRNGVIYDAMGKQVQTINK